MIGAAAVIAGLSGMAAVTRAQHREPYRVLSLQNKNITHVSVETTGGNIEVVHDASADPRVEAYVQVADQKKLTTEQLGAMLEKTYQLQLETEGNLLKAVATRINRNNKARLSISFKVYVPAPGIGVNLSTSGGNIQVENLHGEINGSTGGGSILVQHSQGKIKLATSGGSIKAQHCNGDLDLQTSGGSILIDALNGRGKVATGSGSVKATGIEGSFEAATSHGSIDVRMAKITDPVKLKTSDGSISLAIPANTGADLELEGPRVNVPNLQDFSGRAGNTEIRGKLHGGGAVVQAKALRGRIKLIFQ